MECEGTNGLDVWETERLGFELQGIIEKKQKRSSAQRNFAGAMKRIASKTIVS